MRSRAVFKRPVGLLTLVLLLGIAPTAEGAPPRNVGYRTIAVRDALRTRQTISGRINDDALGWDGSCSSSRHGIDVARGEPSRTRRWRGRGPWGTGRYQVRSARGARPPCGSSRSDSRSRPGSPTVD